MSKICTIGGSGFIGSRLIEELGKDNCQNLDKNPSPFYQDITTIQNICYDGLDVFTEILKEYNNDIKIRTSREEEYGLLRIASKNAKVIVEQEIQMEVIKKKEGDQIQKALEEAKEILNLPKAPRVIYPNPGPPLPSRCDGGRSAHHGLFSCRGIRLRQH